MSSKEKITRNRPSPVEDAILKTIYESTAPMSVTDIHSKIIDKTTNKPTKESIRTILARIVKEGKIGNPSRGKYGPITHTSSLLETVSSHMKERVSTLEYARKYFDGFENWFQIETIAALRKLNLNVSIDDKIKKDTDLIIMIDEEPIGIELKAWKQSHSSNVLNDAFKHKKADYYLIIAEKCPRIFEYLTKYQVKHSFYPQTIDIHENWMLILGANPQLSSSPKPLDIRTYLS